MSELALTDRESRRLKALEDNIRQAGGTMYESLKAIHDEKLYRDNFKTWESYCAERWRMSRQWSYRIIQHGRILALLNDDAPDLSPIGDIPESATREVNGLPDEQKVEVIKQVVSESSPAKGGGKKVTAAAVKAKVEELNAKAPKPIKATADLVESYIDDAGAEVPESLFPVWQQRDTYMRICDDLKTIAGEIGELAKSPAGRGCAFIAKQVNESGKMLALAMPSVVDGKKWKSVAEAGK